MGRWYLPGGVLVPWRCFDAIVQVLGRKTDIVRRAMIRYSDHLEVSTDESMGLLLQGSEKQAFRTSPLKVLLIDHGVRQSTWP